MKLVRTMMLLAAAVMVGAVTMTAQTGQKPTAQDATPQAGQKKWTDDDYDKLMKEVGATVGAMRKAIDGQNAELAKTNASKMVTLFTDAHAFWMQRNVKEAATMANEAVTHAKAVDGAVDAKDFTKASEHAKMLQGTCASCHKQYRDKDPEGNYRIKP